MSGVTTLDGLNFDLSDEQQMLRQTLRELVTKHFPKDACREWEAREEFPMDLWEKLAGTGLHGVGIAEEYGGQGGTILDQIIVNMELSRTMAGLAWLWGIPAFVGGKAIGGFGTEEQKQRYLPAIARGETICAISLTEPDGGTDVLGAMRTTAKRAEGGWVVNGAKVWTTLAHVADVILLVARTEKLDGKPSKGLTVFLCDAKAEGVKATLIPKLGMRSLGSCEVVYEDVFIPDENVIGEPGQGWQFLSETLNSERIMNGANCSGALEGILEEMLSYAKERVAFGKPIGQFQAVQHMIAETHIAFETSRLMTFRAGWLQANGRPCGVEATMGKYIASENVALAAERGLRILGGNGYSLEYDMQRYWRDMMLYRVAPINNSMGLNFIGESLGLPRSF